MAFSLFIILFNGALMTDTRAIGVFDSGFGGLTVLSALHQLLPHESTVYLGDTARLPYGTKSPQTVVRYALNNARLLMEKASLKMLVVACNTVSSVALEALEDALSIPVVGVVNPGAKAAVDSGASAIAVLATAGTIQSKAYEKTLWQLGFHGEIISIACPLFVPLVEEGMVTGSIAEDVARYYLAEIAKPVHAIILGCTHYPLLLPTLQKVFPMPVHWIDSGSKTALWVKNELEKQNLLTKDHYVPVHRYLVTDAPRRFEFLSEFYLGKKVNAVDIDLVDIA